MELFAPLPKGEPAAEVCVRSRKHPLVNNDTKGKEGEERSIHGIGLIEAEEDTFVIRVSWVRTCLRPEP